MFPTSEDPNRRRLTPAAWRVLMDSYRTHFPSASEEPLLPVRVSRPVSEPWQTLDVGPWSKWTFAAGFLTLLVFPTAFPLAFPLGSLVAVILGISHINRRVDEAPVWLT